MSLTSLVAANGRPADTTLQIGEILSIPEPGVVVLKPGDTLWSVARKNDCSAEALARANGLAPNATLQPGARLKLPGAPKAVATVKDSGGAGASKAKMERASAAREPQPLRSRAELRASTLRSRAELRASTAREPAPVSVKNGVVSLFRVATGERLKLTVTDPRGRVRPQAAARMAAFLRPRGSKKQKRPELRLLAHIAEVAKHYPGKTIQVMSGYRVAKGYTSKESRHTKGAAMDIHIDGVSNRALCDYLRTFKKVGVGFYPNSLFVHFDVRDKNAYWIDLSSPGGKPSYLDGEQRQHFDGKNKDEGLVELGRSVAAALGDENDYEPDEGEAGQE